MTAICSNASMQPLPECQHSQVDSLLWKVFPDCCIQHSHEFSFVGWFWSEHFVPRKHSAPDVIFERSEVRWVWWLLILLDELVYMLIDPFLSKARRMGRCTILLEYEVVWQQTFTVLGELRKKIIHAEIFIHLHLNVSGALCLSGTKFSLQNQLTRLNS